MIMATWTVLALHTAPQDGVLQDVVKAVSWLCTDTDGTNEVREGGRTLMAAPEDSFCPYDRLTQEQVIGWVQYTLGSAEVARIEANLTEQLCQMAAPPIVILPLPWAA